jgi:signal transduction histidine kinase
MSVPAACPQACFSEAHSTTFMPRLFSAALLLICLQPSPGFALAEDWAHRFISKFSTAEQARRERIQEIRQSLDSLPPAPPSAQTSQVGYLVPFWSLESSHDIIFDLGEETVLEGIAIVPADVPLVSDMLTSGRSGMGRGFPQHFDIYASADGKVNTPRQLIASTEAAVLPKSDGLPVWLPLKAHRARFLTLRLSIDEENENRAVVIGEVMIFRKGDPTPVPPQAVSFHMPTTKPQPVGGTRYPLTQPLETPPMWSLHNLTDNHSVLGAPMVPAESQAFGFQCGRASRADDVKWVEVDLGRSLPIDSVVLFPTTREIPSATPGFGFPVRFRVETADDASFTDSRLVFSCEQEDFPSPGLNCIRLARPGMTGRYVRLTATKLYRRFFDYALVLGELQVWSGGRNAALGRPVRYRNTFADERFKPEYLVDGLNGPFRIVDTASWLQNLSERSNLLIELAGLNSASAAWSLRMNTAIERSLLAGVPLALLFAAIMWVTSLRRQVARQTEVIMDKVKQQAAGEERSRIARDMHDTVGARLTQLSLLHDIALTDSSLQPGTRETLASAATGTQQVAVAMDEIVWALNPRHDTLPALVSYMAHTAREYLEPLGIACREEIAGDIPEARISSRARHDILGMVKECLQNIAKHARAGHVRFSVGVAEGELWLCLEDDGAAPLVSAPAGPGADGLHNVRERAAARGGSFSLSRVDDTTQARILLPIPGLA